MKVTHLSKPCSIVIKKPKIRVMDEYIDLKSFVVTSASVPTVKQWLDKKKKLAISETFRLDSVIASNVVQDFQDPDYWYIVIANSFNIETKVGASPTLTSKKSTQINPFVQSNSTIANRVISCSVHQTVSTAWTANVSIDNTGDIFNLEDAFPADGLIFQKNQCVIESNDMIEIYLPDWKDELHIAFTGYVNQVSMSDDGETKRINITCEDVTKKLAVTRTNANPSLDPLEAEGDDITAYNTAYTDKKPEEVIKYMLGKTYCDVLQDPAILKKVALAYNEFIQSQNIISRKDTKDITEEDKLAKSKALATLNNIMLNAIDDYVVPIHGKDNEIIGYIGYKARPIPAKSVSGSTTAPFKATPNTTNTQKFGKGEAVFIIRGLDQPAWGLGIKTNSNFDLKISDWRSNDNLIADIARTAFFEFFADASGLLHFRPTNLTLPKVTRTISNEPNKNFMDNYWLTKEKELMIRNYDLLYNDREVFTDIIVQGSFTELDGFTLAVERSLVIGPYSYRRKFGVRMMPQEVRLGLHAPESRKVYGEQRLWRQNAQAYSARVVLEGNSYLEVGNPIFVEKWNAVYYIAEMTHTYNAMQDYDTELSLTYRRLPMCIIGGAYTFASAINNLYKTKEISKSEYDALKTEYATGSLTWGTYRLNVLGVPTKCAIVWQNIPTNMEHSKLLALEVTLQDELRNARKNDQDLIGLCAQFKQYTKQLEAQDKVAQYWQNTGQALITEALKNTYIKEEWDQSQITLPYPLGMDSLKSTSIKGS